MRRYKLILEFDGRPFVGWQRQKNGPSVQRALEEAARGFCGENVTAHAAGRTDAGVHALALPVHVDLPGDHDAETVRDAINHFLRPYPIAVLCAEEVSPDFHARFSATARQYQYRIVNRRAPLALETGRALWIPGAVDAEAMNEAARVLIGHHDFSTFRAAQCQAASPVKTVSKLSVARDGDLIVIDVLAPSFLQHQVRSIAGTLLQTGLGRWRVEDVAAALEARDRSACGPVAPADGLYFVRADYGNN